MPSPLRARVLRTLAARHAPCRVGGPRVGPGARRRRRTPDPACGDGPGPAGPEPVAVDPFVDYEVFQVHYELLVGLRPDLEPAPGFADTWESSADEMTHTFHIRDGMKWSDGEPATCEDAALDLPARARRARRPRRLPRLGLPRAVPGQRRPRKRRVHRRGRRSSPRPTFPTTLLTQAYVPILPKHIWSKYTIEQIGNPEADGYFKNEPPVVGSGPYVAVEWQPGEFIRMARNENYWGDAGRRRTRSSSRTSMIASTMVQALKNGELDYVRGTGADQFDALANEANIGTVEGFSNGYTYLSFNTRADSKGYKGSTSALEDQKFRDALGYALDRRRLVDRVARRPRRRRAHARPAVPRQLARRADDAAHLRHRRGQHAARCRRLQARRRRQARRQGRQADHPAPDVAGLRGPRGATPSSSRAGSSSSGSASMPSSPRKASSSTTCSARRPDGARPTGTSTCGAGSATPIRCRCSRSSPRGQHRDGLERLLLLEPALRRALRAPAEGDRRGHSARRVHRRDAAALLRRRACYHVLYYDSELHAYRTDKFAGWTNQPPDTGTPLFGFGYRSATWLLKDASAVAASPSAATGGDGAAGVRAATTTPGPDRASGGHRLVQHGPIAPRAWSRSSRWSSVAFVLMPRRRAEPEEE